MNPITQKVFDYIMKHWDGVISEGNIKAAYEVVTSDFPTHNDIMNIYEEIELHYPPRKPNPNHRLRRLHGLKRNPPAGMGTGTSIVLGASSGALFKGIGLGVGSTTMLLTGNFRKIPLFVISGLVSWAIRDRIEKGYWFKYGVNVSSVNILERKI